MANLSIGFIVFRGRAAAPGLVYVGRMSVPGEVRER